jgi:hypothetical protein
MSERRKYRKRASSVVVAVQVNLETNGFTYEKWGGTQTCNAGDWLVDNSGDVYTVGSASFSETYRAVSPGVYLKTAPVWAEIAEQAGHVKTKEGVTHYEAGHYIVSNDPSGEDAYAVAATIFEEMYELAT